MVKSCVQLLLKNEEKQAMLAQLELEGDLTVDTHSEKE